MSNKAVKFRRTWIIKAEGISRKWPEDEVSYQEQMVEMALKTVESVGRMYKTLKISVIEI